MYFAKSVDALITFQMDEQRRPSGVVVRQDGQEFAGKLLNDAAARPITEALAIVNESYREQKPLPGSEAMLRKLIEDVTAGAPDYARMSPELAAATRASLPSMQKELTGFGPISAVALRRVNPDGAAIYHVTWKQAAGEAGILLGPNGTIDGAYFERDDD